MKTRHRKGKWRHYIHILWPSAASWKSLKLFEFHLDKCQSLFPIRGCSSALNCNVFFFTLCFLFWSFWSSVQHSHNLPPTRWFEIRVFTKVLGLSNPCLVLLAAGHWNKSLGTMKAQSFSLKDQVTQITGKSKEILHWSWSSARLNLSERRQASRHFYTVWMWCHFNSCFYMFTDIHFVVSLASPPSMWLIGLKFLVFYITHMHISTCKIYWRLWNDPFLM